MEWILIGVCVLVLLIGAVAVMTVIAEEDAKEIKRGDARQGGTADARQAYYMANFWSYDGSEQQDWEE